MARTFDQRTIVITGAGSGIGRELARQLAGQSAVVVAVDINADAVDETARLIAAAGGRCEPQVTDVSDSGAVDKLARAVEESVGPVDILINNAGIAIKSDRFDRIPRRDVDLLIDVNVRGALNCSRAFLPQLLARPEAAIVNVSSLGGLVGLMQQVAYATSKYAVRGFTEALRMDLLDTSVAVIGVYPGPVQTPIFSNSPVLSPEEGAAAQQQMEAASLMSVEKAASLIIAGVRKDRPRILVGREAKMMDLLSRLFPAGYTRLLYRPVKKMMSATVATRSGSRSTEEERD
jgi:NAD(P)-dependent dehydrogenase (short-subunit alcohol dehydrogenase family)